MSPWVPKTQLWWVATLTTGGLAVLVLPLSARWSTKISVDIMEFCDPAQLKDAAKNVWTNVAVVGALLLTVIIAMLQLAPVPPQFDGFEEVADDLASLQELYIAYCLGSLTMVLLSLFTCVINLTYVEPLSVAASIKYFIANPNAFGGAVIELMASCFFLLLSLIVWVFMVYGYPNGFLFVALSTIFMCGMMWYIWDKSTFDPTGKTKKSWEWQWTQRPQSEWPSWVFAPDAKTAAMFRRMGQAALDLEAEVAKPAAKEEAALESVPEPAEAVVPGQVPH